MKNETITNTLKLTIYDKGGTTAYCDYYFYNGLTSETGTTRAGGWGYDKESTTASEVINKFNFLFNLKRGIKWESETGAHSNLKNKHFYGLYKDKTISYGIGLSSVINCLNAFNNVKVKQVYYGRHETMLQVEITNKKDQLKRLFVANDKKANNKKTSKYERKKLINENKKILKVLGD